MLKISLSIITLPGSHLGLSRLAPIAIISISRLLLFFISTELVCRVLKRPVATFPQPHIPTLNLFIFNSLVF